MSNWNGSAEGIYHEMAGYLPSTEGDDAVFVGRGLSLMRALLAALVDLRDRGHVSLGLEVISENLSLGALHRLYTDGRLSGHAKAALHRYLSDLPGFDFRKETQDTQTRHQHGYGQVYWSNQIDRLMAGAEHA
jgi:hypothetical protein